MKNFVHFLDLEITSPCFLFSLLGLDLLPDLLLHLDAIISMSPPICFLAPFITVPSLKNRFCQDLEAKVCSYLSTASTLVVCQVGYISMAEPADAICIVIDLDTAIGFLSCSTVMSGFPPLFHNLSNLFQLYCIWVVPENEQARKMQLAIKA